jgi:hypothetical protein
MPTFSTPHDTGVSSSGTKLTISLDGVSATYVVSNIVLSNTNPGAAADSKINIGHLGQTTGEQLLQMDTPLVIPAQDGGSGRTITFDYIGKSVIFDGATGTYHIQIAGATLVGGTTASYCTVQSSTLTLATNDAIRGQGVLTVSR